MSRERVNALFQDHAEAIERHRRSITSHENVKHPQLELWVLHEELTDWIAEA